MGQHLTRVRNLEEKEAKSMLKVYKGVRQELRDRLEFLPSGKFTAQQMRGTLLQVETAIAEMENGLNTGLKLSTQVMSTLGIEHLARETNNFSKHFQGAVVPLNINAAVIANDVQNLLISQKEASIAAYSSDIRAGISRMITQSTVAQENVAQTVSRISKFFITEEWRLLRIARTELHNVYNLSKLSGMKEIKSESIPDLKKSLIHPMDARTGEDSKALAQRNPIIDMDKPFRFVYNGKERVFQFPPDRPNDRAILVPVRESWYK